MPKTALVSAKKIERTRAVMEPPAIREFGGDTIAQKLTSVRGEYGGRLVKDRYCTQVAHGRGFESNRLIATVWES